MSAEQDSSEVLFPDELTALAKVRARHADAITERNDPDKAVTSAKLGLSIDTRLFGITVRSRIVDTHDGPFFLKRLSAHRYVGYTLGRTVKEEDVPGDVVVREAIYTPSSNFEVTERRSTGKLWIESNIASVPLSGPFIDTVKRATGSMFGRYLRYGPIGTAHKMTLTY